jgi:hypothetical protein
VTGGVLLREQVWSNAAAWGRRVSCRNAKLPSAPLGSGRRGR